MATASGIAEWLISEIKAKAPNRAYQSRLVRELRDQFGEEWTYKNDNGNLAIDVKVLKEFKKLKDQYVIWDRSDQSWRVVDDAQLGIIDEQKALRAQWREESKRLEP